jgi:hypothetical protein
MPVLDNVVGLNFEYYGDPWPAELTHPGVDQSTTYGPMPPAPDVLNAPWPAGENCIVQMVDGLQVSRLAALGNPGGGLVRLTPQQLTDGNATADSAWCPDAGNPNRFDADLLRIRRVRVTIRLQTPNASLRGSLTDGPDAPFINAGTSRGGYRWVPDTDSIRREPGLNRQVTTFPGDVQRCRSPRMRSSRRRHPAIVATLAILLMSPRGAIPLTTTEGRCQSIRQQFGSLYAADIRPSAR